MHFRDKHVCPFPRRQGPALEMEIDPLLGPSPSALMQRRAQGGPDTISMFRALARL